MSRKTLAPHLTQALGVQVSKPQPSSPRVGAQEKEQTQRPPTVVGAEEEEEKQRPSTADSELKLQEEEKVETQDSGVQCDEDMLAQDAAQPMPASMSLRSGRSGAVQLDVVAKTKSSGAEGSCSTTRTAQRAQQVHDGFARDLGEIQAPDRWRRPKVSCCSRELPPPLFFQKARRAKS